MKTFIADYSLENNEYVYIPVKFNCLWENSFPMKLLMCCIKIVMIRFEIIPSVSAVKPL